MTAPAEFSELQGAFARLRAASRSQPAPDLAARRQSLRAVERELLARRQAIIAAIDADFAGRLRHETELAEILLSLEAFRIARRNLAGWMRRRHRTVPLTLMPGRAWLQPQPLGVIGIIAPWNYPLMLALTPLAGALAAGNRVMIKPSELTPRTSALLAELLAAALPADQVVVVSGDARLGAAFSALPFDHLLFTGSTRVGRAVMAAAAENLTPVTLELGGKSPALLLPDADPVAAAADIAFGKFSNAGQTCVAPDYVLAPQDRIAQLVIGLRASVARYFTDAQGGLAMTALLGEKARQRQSALLQEARDRGVRIEPLGPDFPGLPFGPTAVIDPPADIALMQEEIFGPILPLLGYGSLDDAFSQIKSRPRPLALYLFGRNRRLIERGLDATIAGGTVINDTLIHVAMEDLPFGGVGASGIGRYHGREGFDSFSHLKPVFERYGPRLDRLIRPPIRGLQRVVTRLLIGA